MCVCVCMCVCFLFMRLGFCPVITFLRLIENEPMLIRSGLTLRGSIVTIV